MRGDARATERSVRVGFQACQPQLGATGFTAGIALLTVAGVVAYALHASQHIGASMEALLAITRASLLYLVTEALLVEWH